MFISELSQAIPSILNSFTVLLERRISWIKKLYWLTLNDSACISKKKAGQKWNCQRINFSLWYKRQPMIEIQRLTRKTSLKGKRFEGVQGVRDWNNSVVEGYREIRRIYWALILKADMKECKIWAVKVTTFPRNRLFLSCF